MRAVNVAVMMIMVVIMVAVRAMNVSVLVHRVNSGNREKIGGHYPANRVRQ